MFEPSAQVFAALGDPHRLTFVTRLGEEGPLSVTELANGTSITRQAVSKHLRVLEEAGLAQSEKIGRERLWALEQRPLRDARDHLEMISQQWDEAIGRLRAFVEED